MSTEPKLEIEYGFPDRRAEFSDKYLRLMQSMPALKAAWDCVLTTVKPSTNDQKVMYGLGRLALEDEFQAMILLCANGYSETAIQVLRGLFEKTVTLSYLNKHPEEIERFINFSWIDRKKEINRIGPILTRFGTQPRKEVEDEIRQRADDLKDEFKSGQWGTKNIVDMAVDVAINQGFIHLG